MKFDDRLGIVYDTFFFGIIYFNYDAAKKSIDPFDIPAEDIFKYYDEIKKEIPELPKELYPFFYSDFIQRSFFIKFIWENFDYYYDDYDKLIKKIKSDTNIKEEFVRYYISNKNFSKFTDISELVICIISLELKSELKLRIIEVLIKFDEILLLLFKTLDTIHNAVKRLHENMLLESQAIVQKYEIEQIKNIALDYDHEDSKKYIENMKCKWITLSYLNISLYVFRYINYDFFFILGFSPDSVIMRMFKIANYNFLKESDVFEVLAHPVKREILEKLREKEFTATQLSDILNVTRQSINTHILLLYEFKFIYISKRNGPEKYYKLNDKFIYAARALINQYMSFFIKGGDKSE